MPRLRTGHSKGSRNIRVRKGKERFEQREQRRHERGEERAQRAQWRRLTRRTATCGWGEALAAALFVACLVWAWV